MFSVDEDDRLDTNFSLNVVGTTQFPFGLIVSGTITAEAVDTTSKGHSLTTVVSPPQVICPSLCIGSSDFERLLPIDVIIDGYSPLTDVRLFTVNDEITLEFEDRVLLRFTPAQATLISGLASNYEYIRDTAVVNIIDNDRMSHVHVC